MIQWSTVDAKVWMQESAEIRDTIYPKETNLGYQYLFKHLPTVKLRLKQAGVRMAAYLNYIFENNLKKRS